MSTTLFRDDDVGYQRWTASHSSGWVLNCARKPTASYLKLHRAGCRTITGVPAKGRRWTANYIKICSIVREEIDHWARTESGGTPQPCELCVLRRDRYAGGPLP